MDRRTVLTGLSGFVAAGPAVARQREQLGRRLVQTPGGYSLSLDVQSGPRADLPTIILEAGGGADSTQWAALQPRLVAETGATVVSYDRAGFGQSPLPAKPYDIVEEVTALHDALIQLRLADKVLLVGHSYGGLLIQVYANRWAATVKGLLFLDPNNPTAMLGMGADAGEQPITNPKTPKERALARVDAAGGAKYTAVYQSPLPISVPVIVASAETPPFRKSRQIAVFKLSHQLLAASVNDGEMVIAERSNHMIPAQRPDLVVTLVSKLMMKP
jgi:pimeloyl-ACP methyl ester carboxylesterase